MEFCQSSTLYRNWWVLFSPNFELPVLCTYCLIRFCRLTTCPARQLGSLQSSAVRGKRVADFFCNFSCTCVHTDTRAHTYAIAHSSAERKRHGFSPALQQKWVNTPFSDKLSSLHHRTKNKWWILTLKLAVGTFVGLILNCFLRNQDKNTWWVVLLFVCSFVHFKNLHLFFLKEKNKDLVSLRPGFRKFLACLSGCVAFLF